MSSKHFHALYVLCTSPRIILPQRHWLKISNQSVKEETLPEIILRIHKRNPSILARTIKYMLPNSLWTPVKFTVSSFIPNCSCPSSSQHHEYAKNRFLSPLQARIHGPINLSLPSLDGWHWSVCHTIQMQYLRLVFSAGPIVSSFTAETHPTEHGLVWCNNHQTNGSFPTFNNPFISLAKTPLNCLVSRLLNF